MTKGEKNETKALWVLSEAVRGLMYGRADAARGSWGARVWVVISLAEVSWQAGHRGKNREREREREREKRSRHVSYVMIIRKHRGRLFATLPGLGGTGLCPRAGVQGWETQERREEGQVG